MKNIELSRSELESIVGGSEAHINLGRMIGYAAQKTVNFVDWLFTPTSGGAGNWTPYPGMLPGSMGLK
ncbi:hypothetical protein [Oleiharenicola sp. Vm1]|uniref:hypothetical protein n=1 Tax=Oleiharenicola sp. Vm1 TaxID=3398393 RepID=UPI0039F4EFBC